MNLSVLSGEAGFESVAISGLTADSRKVKPGYLFAAIPGVEADGARFISSAIEAGAAAILARPGVAADAPLIADDNPRRRYALMCARFFGRQPDFVAAVTGTNGKTSVAHFARQLWAARGVGAASMGTLGVMTPSGRETLQHTTPDASVVHDTLARLADAGVDRLALEASSHGLAQHRLDGVVVRAAGFTNITQDHLDYHADFEDYFNAKLRLFGELLTPDGLAVIDAGGAGATRVIEACRARGVAVMTVGRGGEDIDMTAVTPHAEGQIVDLSVNGAALRLDLPLIGGFQAANALVAVGLVAASEGPSADLAEIASLATGLAGAPGRLEKAGATEDGAAVYVDYAHTPDAIATMLAAVRPHAEGRLIVVIGAGGDRDRTKRPLMGAAAAQAADMVIVSDDNPRSEDPGAIRADVMKGAPEAIEIAGRGEAIERAVSLAGAGDIVVVAGKGHETGQTIGDKTLPFDDVAAARAALTARGGRA